MKTNRTLQIQRDSLAEFCQRHYIRRLALFGSALRQDFRPDSDVDVLVEFEPGHTPGLAFFEMEEELAGIFGRKVDLVEKRSLRNPFRRHSILKSAHTVYGHE